LKIAILADIHGNMHAFQTVLESIDSWHPDAVVMAGDVINRGPRPLACLELLKQLQRTQGWKAVRGNHEDYVLAQARLDMPKDGPLFEISQSAFWTYSKINGKLDSLKDMPFEITLPTPNNGIVRAVHASMLGNRDGIYPETTNDELRKKILPAPDVLCVGHTHRPLVRRVDQTLVVNVGAVGTPFDGDVRASYARLTWQNNQWRGEIVRLKYDREGAENEYASSGFVHGGGPLAAIMFLEFQQARSHIPSFLGQYEESIVTEKISLKEAVAAYLKSVSF
jgi:putative phosphoesterase